MDMLDLLILPDYINIGSTRLISTSSDKPDEWVVVDASQDKQPLAWAKVKPHLDNNICIFLQCPGKLFIHDNLLTYRKK